MPPPKELFAKFGELRTVVDAVESRVVPIMQVFCRDKGFPFLYRKKEIDSALEKIETGRYADFSQIDDILACSVVIPTLREEPEVISFINRQFKIRTNRGRATTQKAPEVFRFDSTRVIATLLPGPVDAGEASAIFGHMFEIQVRTALEHAWSAAMHPLVYKTSVIDWRRKRLSAQIKATLETLDSLIYQFDAAANSIPESSWKETKRQMKISGLFQELIKKELIPTEVAPHQLSRFCENFDSMLERNTMKRVDFDKCLSALDLEIRAMAAANKIPRSTTLLQTCIAILLDKQLIGPKFDRFCCHITDEATSIFPALKNVSPTFSYST